ncbi:MAG: hypothetical protein IJ130_04960 [Solobacterium sp.]|nr:hypothetical protein [Solobacterium sp.]
MKRKRKVRTLRLLFMTVVMIFLAAVPSVLYERWENTYFPDDNIMSIIFKNPIEPVEEDWVTYRYDHEGNWQSTEISGITYLSQNDPRWSGLTIGGYTVAHSGCSPSVGAMLVNRVCSVNLTPYDIGKEFYEWNYMNSGREGTSPKVWKKLGQEYDLRYVNHLSEEGFIQALQSGWIVVMSVQGPPFTRESTADQWISHTILVYGLNSAGSANVMDPYSSYNTRAFNAQELFEMRVKLFDASNTGAVHAFAPEA